MSVISFVPGQDRRSKWYTRELKNITAMPSNRFRMQRGLAEPTTDSAIMVMPVEYLLSLNTLKIRTSLTARKTLKGLTASTSSNKKTGTTDMRSTMLPGAFTNCFLVMSPKALQEASLRAYSPEKITKLQTSRTNHRSKSCNSSTDCSTKPVIDARTVQMMKCDHNLAAVLDSGSSTSRCSFCKAVKFISSDDSLPPSPSPSDL
mmetsp:Transcript_170682/g.547496  ORF Transcript_170682/g.547496 Transcript_170682/m.547496 type:complete len:204 (-) Transcript_170682:288-899(-)